MIEIKNVSKAFGSNVVLRDVSFSLEEKEIVGLVGPSGAGKSVLLKIMGNVLAADQGQVSGLGAEEMVGFLFQEGALFDSMSVLENVTFPLNVSKRADHCAMTVDERVERAYNILEKVGLGPAYKKMPGQLSGGMRRRAALARAIVCDPALVLLDDPTAGLDPVAASVIMDLIKTLHSQVLPTLVMVSQDLRRLLPSVERVMALFEGELVCDTAARDLLENAPSYVFDFLKTRYDFETQPLQ